MNIRKIARTIPAQAISEGAGVTVHRTIGTQALRNLDPFLMLDHFGSDNPNEYIAGFPDHPHRGFITFTYMLDGHMLHKDSMGNTGDLRAGGAQWMKAASGVIHSEMPQQSQGLMRGFQLWINLPAKEKMSAPEYQEFTPEAVAEVSFDGGKARVLCGDFQGQRGVISDPNTEAFYLDISLAAQKQFIYQTPPQHNCFVYVFEGSATVESQTLPRHSLAVLAAGDSLQINAGSEVTRFIVVGGKPIGEPIVQYGPFVMNTRAEIEQAFMDYQAGRLVRSKAAMTGR
ncbi:MAG: pirin family protein [Betaproteobacteria bacterium]|nr:pirin family protein [Betaproteobacteria bacterium]